MACENLSNYYQIVMKFSGYYRVLHFPGFCFYFSFSVSVQLEAHLRMAVFFRDIQFYPYDSISDSLDYFDRRGFNIQLIIIRRQHLQHCFYILPLSQKAFLWPQSSTTSCDSL